MIEFALALAAFLGWLLLRRRRGSKAGVPMELQCATLAYAEKLFRDPGPVALTAKVDRAYRVEGKALILIELKTRRPNRPYHSDVIELSALPARTVKRSWKWIIFWPGRPPWRTCCWRRMRSAWARSGARAKLWMTLL